MILRRRMGDVGAVEGGAAGAAAANAVVDQASDPSLTGELVLDLESMFTGTPTPRAASSAPSSSSSSTPAPATGARAAAPASSGSPLVPILLALGGGVVVFLLLAVKR